MAIECFRQKNLIKYIVSASITILELGFILHTGVITVGHTFLIPFLFHFKQLYVS